MLLYHAEEHVNSSYLLIQATGDCKRVLSGVLLHVALCNELPSQSLPPGFRDVPATAEQGQLTEPVWQPLRILEEVKQVKLS